MANLAGQSNDPRFGELAKKARQAATQMGKDLDRYSGNNIWEQVEKNDEGFYNQSERLMALTVLLFYKVSGADDDEVVTSETFEAVLNSKRGVRELYEADLIPKNSLT